MTDADTRQDRNLLQVLPLAECLELMDSASVGRLGFEVDGQPMILPVNHLRSGMQVGFRSADGAKVDAVRSVARVAFEVDGYDDETRTGWSVLGLGTARLANDIETSHFESGNLTPWADGVPRDHWIVIDLTHVTGRRVNR